MEKRLDAEFLLPEAIIHHIQSFLDGKQAGQTSILSKSWYNAWLTCPNLEIDQRLFRNRGDVFSEFARKTLQRYHDLNLKIDSFKLCWEKGTSPLAYELIPKAIECGATDLDFKLSAATLLFVLPHDVLASETLTRLSVSGCKLEYAKKVNCSKLKSLHLREVFLEGDMIWDVLSSCPLIEDLVLADCQCFVLVQFFQYFKDVINFTTKKRMLAFDPSFESQKLRSLFLEKVKITNSFFCDLSSRFPCLKDLSVHYCSGYKEIKICSDALESISFEQKMKLKAQFDVPNIRKFKISCSSSLPLLSFKTASNEWVSDISISCEKPSASWFLSLNKLLTNLSSSQIYLSLRFSCGERSFDFTSEIEILPVVKNMRLSCMMCSSAILDGIFWSCRPVLIIVEKWSCKSVCKGLAERVKHLLNELTGDVSEEDRQQHPYLDDLKEVSLFELESFSQEWQPLPWKTFLEASPVKVKERTICFRMGWESEHSMIE